MAQTGYTPIQIYSSSTASNTPAAGNLTNSALGSELAINITDGKLFYKDNNGNVQVIAWKVVPTTAGGTGLTSYTAGDTLYYSAGSTLSKLAIGSSGYYMSSSGTAPQWSAPAALTSSNDTNVTVTLGGNSSTALLNAASITIGWTGQLGISRGGTNSTSSPTAGAVAYGTGTAYAFTTAGTANQVLISNGAAAPSWSNLSSLGVSSFSAGTTGFTPNVATTGAITLAGTLGTANGGTGLTGFSSANNAIYSTSSSVLTAGTLPVLAGGTGQTSFTAGYVHFGSFSTDSNFFWDNTNKRLGLGTSSPGFGLDLQSTSATTASNVSIARLWGKSSGNTTSAFGSLIQIGTQNPNGNNWFAYVGGLNSPGGGSNYAELGLFSGTTGNVPLETARCDYNGYLLVGYTSSNGAYRLQVNSQIFATSATIATSDGRYKENVQPLNGALDMVMAMNPVQFNWKKHPVHNFVTDTPTVGFIAQEMQQVLANKPYLNSIVKKNDCLISPAEYDEIGNVKTQAVYEEFFGIAEGNLVAVLAKAIQELKSEFDQYKANHP
jgi:Chaperone of endosialidase